MERSKLPSHLPDSVSTQSCAFGSLAVWANRQRKLATPHSALDRALEDLALVADIVSLSLQHRYTDTTRIAFDVACNLAYEKPVLAQLYACALIRSQIELDIDDETLGELLAYPLATLLAYARHTPIELVPHDLPAAKLVRLDTLTRAWHSLAWLLERGGA